MFTVGRHSTRSSAPSPTPGRSTIAAHPGRWPWRGARRFWGAARQARARSFWGCSRKIPAFTRDHPREDGRDRGRHRSIHGFAPAPEESVSRGSAAWIAARHRPALVILDTMAKAMPRERSDLNNYSVDATGQSRRSYAMARPRWRGPAILFSHHNRKGRGRRHLARNCWAATTIRGQHGPPPCIISQYGRRTPTIMETTSQRYGIQHGPETYLDIDEATGRVDAAGTEKREARRSDMREPHILRGATAMGRRAQEIRHRGQAVHGQRKAPHPRHAATSSPKRAR